MFYYEVKKFVKKNIKVPKDYKKFIPKEIQEEFKDYVNTTIDNTNVIILDLDKLEDKHIPCIDSLKDLNLPFDSFFIEVISRNRRGGIQVTDDGKGKIEIISYTKNKDDSIIPMLFYIDKKMLPRFYIGCMDLCDKFISTKQFSDFLNNKLCMRTPRTAEFCFPGTMAMLTLELIILTLNELNRKPEYVEYSFPPPSPTTPSSKNKPKSKSKQKFIYLNKAIYPKKEGGGGKGVPKSPHTRRGHYRYYKNGKVVWISPTEVKGGKGEQKFYKI